MATRRPSPDKAEIAFKSSLKSAIENRDFDEVAQTFQRYGGYLELIGGNTRAEQKIAFTASSKSDTVRMLAF